MREEVERKEMITFLLGKLRLRCLAFTQSGDFSKLLDIWVWSSEERSGLKAEIWTP